MNTSWSSFPHVGKTLPRWDILEAAATSSEIETKLGVKVGDCGQGTCGVASLNEVGDKDARS
jgi:hypothetical protein